MVSPIATPRSYIRIALQHITSLSNYQTIDLARQLKSQPENSVFIPALSVDAITIDAHLHGFTGQLTLCLLYEQCRDPVIAKLLCGDQLFGINIYAYGLDDNGQQSPATQVGLSGIMTMRANDKQMLSIEYTSGSVYITCDFCDPLQALARADYPIFMANNTSYIDTIRAMLKVWSSFISVEVGDDIADELSAQLPYVLVNCQRESGSLWQWIQSILRAYGACMVFDYQSKSIGPCCYKVVKNMAYSEQSDPANTLAVRGISNLSVSTQSTSQTMMQQLLVNGSVNCDSRKVATLNEGKIQASSPSVVSLFHYPLSIQLDSALQAMKNQRPSLSEISAKFVFDHNNMTSDDAKTMVCLLPGHCFKLSKQDQDQAQEHSLLLNAIVEYGQRINDFAGLSLSQVCIGWQKPGSHISNVVSQGNMDLPKVGDDNFEAQFFWESTRQYCIKQQGVKTADAYQDEFNFIPLKTVGEIMGDSSTGLPKLTYGYSKNKEAVKSIGYRQKAQFATDKAYTLRDCPSDSTPTYSVTVRAMSQRNQSELQDIVLPAIYYVNKAEQFQPYNAGTVVMIEIAQEQILITGVEAHNSPLNEDSKDLNNTYNPNQLNYMHYMGDGVYCKNDGNGFTITSMD